VSDTEITAVYRYSRSYRDYPAGLPEDQWPALDARRAPQILALALEAGQLEITVREVPDAQPQPRQAGWSPRADRRWLMLVVLLVILAIVLAVMP
jgi:hypothetical protein